MNFNEVFTYDHLYRSALKCFRGVGWKREVQSFRNVLAINIYNLQNKLLHHTYKSRGFYEFDINERGKTRHIKAIYLEERIVQKCLCDYYLIPLLTKTFIYDSGASQKGKGISFTLNRLEVFMHKYFRTYRNNGYYLKVDFEKYFESIDHNILKDKLTHYLADLDLRKLVFTFIDNCGEVGLGLGSEVSQICSLFFVSSLDHYIKERLHAKYYIRYMDDCLIMSDNKEYLVNCLNAIKCYCLKLNIKINGGKTQIIKLSRGIRFLKRQFILTENGKVVKHLDKTSFTRERRKLKRIPTYEARLNSYISWSGTYLGYNDYFKTKAVRRFV